jgi:catalase
MNMATSIAHYHPPLLLLRRDEEVNYFPSRFDPARNAAPTPMNKATVNGRRERAVIAKENNFQQVRGVWMVLQST